MAWLASLGHTVVGIELAESALVQFFHEQKIEYNISQIDEFKVFKVKQQNTRFFQGKSNLIFQMKEQRRKNNTLQWGFFQIHEVNLIFNLGQI